MPKIKYNWPNLIAEFEASDLSQTAYCQTHDINPKYFNRKLAEHRAKPVDSSGFSKVAVQPSPFLNPSTGLVIELGQCKIHCPESMPIESFALLVRTLA